MPRSVLAALLVVATACSPQQAADETASETTLPAATSTTAATTTTMLAGAYPTEVDWLTTVAATLQVERTPELDEALVNVVDEACGQLRGGTEPAELGATMVAAMEAATKGWSQPYGLIEGQTAPSITHRGDAADYAATLLIFGATASCPEYVGDPVAFRFDISDGVVRYESHLPAAPIHAVPTGAVAVTGTATCVFSDVGGLQAVCELDMSDARVSGTEVSDNYRHLTEDFEEAVAVVWIADDVITNDEGTWRGVTQASDDSTPCGESHLVGEGPYAGLEFHYYFCHTEDEAQLRGWIGPRE